MRREESGPMPDWSNSVPRYVDADENWVSTEPRTDLYLRGVVVADDCPICCPWCTHQLDKPKKLRRKITITDFKTASRKDSACVLCFPENMQTEHDYNLRLKAEGLHVMAGDNPHLYLTGGGSKQLEDRDASKNHPQRIAKPKAPTGSGSDTYRDETEKVTELGFVPGADREILGTTKSSDEDTFAAIAADESTATDDALLAPDKKRPAKKLPLASVVCTPQQHKSLTSEFRLKRRLKGNEHVVCPVCKREVFAA
jgi:hypothetical protein